MQNESMPDPNLDPKFDQARIEFEQALRTAEQVEQIEYKHGFQIGSFRLLHDSREVVEVLQPQKVSPIPNVPDWLLGLTNIRGNLVPVFDLLQYFETLGHEGEVNESGLIGERAPSSEKQWMLVFGSGQRSAVTFIDGLPVQLRFTEGTTALAGGDASAQVPEKLRPFSMGIFRVDNHDWVQVDFDKIFMTLGETIARRAA